MAKRRFKVLGPLMGGPDSRAFLGYVRDDQSTTSGVRPVVMVFLPEEVTSNQSLLERVVAETAKASQIDHVNVMGVYGVARLEEGTARIVEFADGETLETLLKESARQKVAVPFDLGVSLVVQAAKGIHYAHELFRMDAGHPLVHGDLQPSRILVSFAGYAKVAGYGARTLAEHLKKKRSDENNLRDPYAAPEQLFGGPDAASVQSDVYALGATLFRVVVGEPLIDPNAPVADALIRDDVDEHRLEKVPVALRPILRKALARNASQRYKNALAFREELEQTVAVLEPEKIATHMERIFPLDYPSRVTRFNLLVMARDRPVTDTRLRVQTPMLVGDEDKPLPPPARLPQMPGEFSNSPESQLAEIHSKSPMYLDEKTLPAHEAPDATEPSRSMPLPSTKPRSSSTNPPRTSSAPPQAATQQTQISGAASSIAPTAGASVSPQPYAYSSTPPSYTQPPQVVYKAPPWLLAVTFALLGVVATAAYFVTRTGNTPVAAASSDVDVPSRTRTSDATRAPERDIANSGVDDKAVPVTPPPVEPIPQKSAERPVRQTPDEGTLAIETEPEITILVDGKKLGAGEAVAEVKAGTHVVTLTAPHFKKSHKVAVVGGKRKSVVYRYGKGGLTVAAPEGAEIVIDGKRVGYAPISRIALFEGSYTVVVKQGGIPYTQRISVKPGNELDMWVDFKQTP